VAYELVNEEGKVLATGAIDTEVAHADCASVTHDLSAVEALDAEEEAFIHFTAK
jgi:hypothetical protein